MVNRIYFRLKFFIFIVIGMVVLSTIIIPISNFLDIPQNPINTQVRVITPIDSLSLYYSADQILHHNNIVISTLQEREATAHNALMNREGMIKQARTIYFAVLALLLTLMFSNKKENGRKDVEVILIMLLILVMYLVEVHSEDLLKRQDSCTEIIARSTEQIVNAEDLYSIWYKLDYSEYINGIHTASDGSLERKIIKAFHPDIEQRGIYFVPLIIIYIISLINFIGKKNKLT